MTNSIICMGFISSCSVRKGGPNPVSNTVLATILEKAKDLDVPKDIVERNIKRASEKGQEDFIEKIYEVKSQSSILDLCLQMGPLCGE